MPRGLDQPCTRFALHAGFDAREWSGVNVFDVQGGSVVLPDYEDFVFPDTLSFLNCHSSNVSPSVLTGGIGDDDLVYLFYASSFTLNAGSDNALFGLPTTSTVATGPASGPEGAGYYVYATSDWERGYQRLSDGIDTTVESGIWVGAWTSMAAALRGESSSSIDYPGFDSLSTLADAASTAYYRFGMNDEGHVVITATTSAFAWVDDDFRQRLGFSGDEGFSYDGSRYVKTADYPMPGCWHPTRPADLIGPSASNLSSSGIRTDGAMVNNDIATHQRWSLSGWVDGPMDTKDDHLFFLRHVLPYIQPGKPCALYQDWGETRLYTWRGDYDETFTNEALGGPAADPGYRGRIQGYILSGTDMHRVSWPQALKRRSPIEIVIQEYPFDGQWEF